MNYSGFQRLSSPPGGSLQHERNMKAPTETMKSKRIAANLRSWRVLIMRSRGEYLGSVEAPDREKAEAVAIKLFDLDHDQRSRLLILERL
jgi:hypothetical protein